jgi:hypothetical protein
MRGAVFIGFLFAFAAAATAQVASPPADTPARPERPKRDYSGKVQMHQAPLDLSVPDTSFDEGNSVTESLGLSTEQAIHEGARLPPPPPPAVRRKADDSQKSKNWILPPTPDGKPRETEDIEPSGWGWLADEVRSQQRKDEEKTPREDIDSEKRGNQDKSEAEPAAREDDRRDTASRKDFLEFEPVPTDDPMQRSRKREVMEAVVEDRKSGEREKKDDDTDPAAGNQKQDETESEERTHPFGADSIWGNDAMWDRNRKTENPLPQTAALLSQNPKVERPGDAATPAAFESSMLSPVLPDADRAANLPERVSEPLFSTPPRSEMDFPAPRSVDSFAPPLSPARNPFSSPFDTRSPATIAPSATMPADTLPASKDPWAMPGAP